MEPDRRRRITRTAIPALFFLAVLWLVIALDQVFGPLLFALLLAYILHPVVDWLSGRTKLPRGGAIALLFVIFYALLLAFFLLTVPEFVSQVGRFYQAAVGERVYEAGEVEPGGAIRPLPAAAGSPGEFFEDRNGNGAFDPGYLRAFARWIVRLRRELGEEEGYAVGLERVQEYLAATGGKAVSEVATVVGNAVYTIFGLLTLFLLIPIYLFFFLLGFDQLRQRTVELLPGRYRDRIVRIVCRIDEAVSAFFKGRLVIMVIKGAMVSIVLLVIGLPYALLLGVITGVGSLIPLVGSVCGLIPAVLIALLDSGSTGLALLVAAVFVVIEVFENYALTPMILKDRVGLHPLTILVSVYVAGALFGFVGMLLSVPLASVAKILYTEFVNPHILALAAEAPPPE